MKNTRKKMLLSSVAMLLVALVALGSATYAWYANVTSVTAEKNEWSASTSDGLVIKHHLADPAWKTAVTDLKKAPNSLSPRAIQFTDGSSTNIGYDAVVGASAVATNRDSYAATDHHYISHADLVADSAGYLVDEMYVAGENGDKTVKMFVKSNKAADASSYLNLAVYVDGNLKEVFSTSTNKTKDLTVGAGNAVSEGAEYTTTALATTNKQVGGASFTFTAASKDNDGTKIQVIAYADGFNTSCKTATVDTSTWSVDYTFSV